MSILSLGNSEGNQRLIIIIKNVMNLRGVEIV